MPKQARYQVTTLESSQVDAAKGTIKLVSVMTEGEALGHGVRADLATLQKLKELAASGGVKAFLNHSLMPAPTEAVGIFSGFYLDTEEGQPAKLRATFTALKAFRTHSPKEFDTLFELAAEAPGSFGVSVSIFQDLEDAEDGGNPYIRPTTFESADFVSTPAANKALFAAKVGIDISNTSSTPSVSDNSIQPDPVKPSTSKPSRHSMKLIAAKFSANPVALAKAVKYMADNEAATEEQAVVEVEKEISAEDLAALKAENEKLKADNAALVSKVAELEGKAAELSAPAAELPAAKEALAAAQAEVATVKEQLAAATVRLARYGVQPLATVKVASGTPPATQLSRADFDKLTPSQQGEFFSKGGKLVQ